MIEVFLFGLVIGFVGRTVLDRGPDTVDTSPKPPSPVGMSQPPNTMPQTNAPPGWPANVNHADCEAYMAKFSKEELSTLMSGMMTKTDVQWEAAKAQMVKLGQAQLASCLDGARQVIKTMTPPGVTPGISKG
jgi:hypothetical protein